MSELIKTLNLLLDKTHVNDSPISCEPFGKNTRLLPCYLSPKETRNTDCDVCVLNSNTEAKPIVEILSKFHE